MLKNTLNWHEDPLDFISIPGAISIKEQAQRKSLARNNQHFFTEESHEKRTTLARGFISELAVRYYFKNINSANYITPCITSFNPKKLMFTEDKILSITAAHFFLLLYHIEKTEKKIWYAHAKKIGDLLINRLVLQQHFFQERQTDLERAIYLFEDRFDFQKGNFIPKVPYFSHFMESITQALDVFSDHFQINKHCQAKILAQLEYISTILDQNCTYLFRDANPNNTLIPIGSDLPKEISRTESLKTITHFFSKWAATKNKPKLFKNIVQIDFELVGLKKTNQFDDFIHIIGMIPSHSLRQNAISSFTSSLTLEKKNLFYLTWAFRMTREGARRLRYFSENTLDKPENYDKRYEIWGIIEEFEYMFLSSASSLKSASKITGKTYNELIYLMQHMAFLIQKLRKQHSLSTEHHVKQRIK
ncbi:hypothetical protein [Legionella yabuuchiae]|uniref:hypothetical protein n=1 Tax=Legionella yabuuchiae TaxID=376727 RepID=UPI001054A82E|nr:hypothetical protein [Legionella yabuuchiae]